MSWSGGRRSIQAGRKCVSYCSRRGTLFVYYCIGSLFIEAALTPPGSCWQEAARYVKKRPGDASESTGRRESTERRESNSCEEGTAQHGAVLLRVQGVLQDSTVLTLINQLLAVIQYRTALYCTILYCTWPTVP